MDDRDGWTTGYLARIEGIVAEHGWAIQGVLASADDDPEPGPPFAYTVGLSSPRFDHPELVVIGLSAGPAQAILNDLGERVRGGQRLHAGKRIGGLLRGGYEVELLAVDDAADERAPLSVANRLYGHGGPVEALQVVLPDEHHRLPWDPGFDAGMRAIQPLLGRRAAPATRSRGQEGASR
jgi:Domain of unknown function (DUF4262)